MSEMIRGLFALGDQETLAAAIDVMLVALLIVVLVEQEIVRAYRGPRVDTGRDTASVVIWPLFVAFAVIVVARAAGVR